MVNVVDVIIVTCYHETQKAFYEIVEAVGQKNMSELNSWRDLLKVIISDNRERLRIAEELGLSPITLNRWVNQDSDPRPQNLQRLLNAVPQYRDQMIELIREEDGFAEFSNAELDDASKDIPAIFYNNIFAARASAHESMRYWSICNLILQQAIGQLDPDRSGLAITIMRCMPPRKEDNKIHSPRISIGLGTPPWQADLEQRTMFLGAESLAGYAVASCRPEMSQNVDEDYTQMPLSRVKNEKSSAAYPILFSGKIAGCIVISSTQVNYFLSQSRLNLIKSYADLFAVAFEPEEFYAPDMIELRVMPDQEIQKPFFANFRWRVANTMLEAARNKQTLSNIEAEKRVWEHLEDELAHLKAAASTNSSDAPVSETAESQQ